MSKTDVDGLTLDQMILKSIDSRLKRIEKLVGDVQEDVEDLTDSVDDVKEVIGLLEPVADDDEEQA